MNSPGNDSKIVQCPACQTKFAIKLSAIKNLANPKFHCSRCDNVFGEDSQIDLGLNIETVQESISDFSDVDQYNREYESSAFKPEDEHLDTFSDTERLPIDYESSSDNTWKFDEDPIITENKNEQAFQVTAPGIIPPKIINNATTKEVEANQTTDFKWTDAPIQETKKATTGIQQIEMVLNPGIKRKKIIDETPHDLPNFKDPTAEIEQPLKTEDQPAKKTTLKSGAVAWAKKLPKIKFPQLSLWDNSKSISSYKPSARIFSRWQSLKIACTPLVVMLILLLISGYLLTSSPIYAYALAKKFSPSLPEVPPAELLLTKTKHRIVLLESGEKIHVISGTVKNTSNRTFSKVSVEGLMYDQQNKLTERQVVDINSSLTSARIQSLSWEMIENLMHTAQTKRFSLTPDESAQFVIAINSMDAKKAKAYSARIYSVL